MGLNLIIYIVSGVLLIVLLLVLFLIFIENYKRRNKTNVKFDVNKPMFTRDF
jgi:hypothetical protein